MKVQDVLKKGIVTLKDANVDDAMLQAKMLLANILDVGKEKLVMLEDKEIEKSKEKVFFEDIEKIIDGYPIQYILNNQEFMKMDFFVNEDVLIPRSDTEILVEEAIGVINKDKRRDVLELCTGSGAIAISLEKYIERIEITATDISKNALDIARKNEKKLISNERINFIVSDMFEKIDKKFDMIISNPPYIKSDDIKKYNLKYEPKIALDGGQDGMKFYEIIINEGYKYLNENGIIMLEIGFDQKNDVLDIVKKSGRYCENCVKKDLAGNDRVVVIK